MATWKDFVKVAISSSDPISGGFKAFVDPE